MKELAAKARQQLREARAQAKRTPSHPIFDPPNGGSFAVNPKK